MDDDNASIGGSVVSLSKKPPTKGRKKKSAAAKLAQKKRQNSDGGSEYGSNISLQKGNEGENQAETGTSLTKSEQGTKNLNNGEHTTENKVKDTTVNINNVNNEKSVSSVNKEKETKNSEVPKPHPRRLSRQKRKENRPIPDDLKGGIVVSIYDDKVDKFPPRPSDKRSVSNTQVKDKETKRELFPADNQSDKTFQNKQTSSVSDQFKVGLNPLGDLPPLKIETHNKTENVELSPPVPMDLGVDSDEDKNAKDEDISKNAPSDATVHRFRAMRMTPDRTKSEESLKNAQFVPKPPPTPKSARKNLNKGEKRTHEANSSGEEADSDAKKQNSYMVNGSNINTSLSDLQPIQKMEVDEDQKVGKTDPSPIQKGLRLHPNVMEISDIMHDNINQNMNRDTEQDALQDVGVVDKGSNNVVQVSSAGALTVSSNEISPDKFFNKSPDKLAFEPSPEKPMNSPPDGVSQVDLETKKSSRKTDKKKGKKSKLKTTTDTIKLASLDGSDLASPGKSSVDTIGSASDLQAITENYREVLKDKSPGKILDTPHPGPSSFVTEKVLPEPKPNAGRLTPIQPKSTPPPLPQDMKSTSLRTTYKADPAYAMSKLFARSFSGVVEKDKSAPDTLSQRSLMATPMLHSLSTREARNRMKHGTTGSQLLSSSELDRYFPNRKVGLWVGSWNMAEIKDCKEPLDDFLLPEISEYLQDMYAIGTQENAMNKKEWEILLQETIGPSHVLFHSASHGALHLAVFIKRDLIWFCTVPEDDLVQTRAVTMVKTKGAIAISFQFFGTTFVFINCHFAPGDDKKKERLDDFYRIIKNLTLPKQGNTGSPNSSTQDVTTRFDCVFWLGDLNFRIELYKGKQAVEDVVRSIQEQEHPNFEDLVSGDQLTKLIVEGSIFQGFQEGRINFKPTYKFDIGKDTYDTSSKNRIPSYTDRVLFRAKKKNAITCVHYDSPINIRLSDHKPVFALFEAAIKPARECTAPLAAGQFDRAVYSEANRRRSMKVEVINTLQNNEKSSKTCTIQ